MPLMSASLTVKMNRFADINIEEQKEILDNIDAKNTKKATATAVEVFRDYLCQKGKDVEVVSCKAEDIDSTLSKFYLEARSKKDYISEMSCLVIRLDKEKVKLFQQPAPQEKDCMNYIGVPLGHNRLGSKMVSLSVKVGLSVRYTNHSLRATTVHVLDTAQIPSRHIMTVTGHKAESSLKTYTGYTK